MNSPPENPVVEREDRICIARRRWVLGGAACAALLGASGTEAAAADPARLPPAPGDLLVFPAETHGGRAVKLADLPPSGQPLLVYPRDPVTRVVRDRNRLNQILLLRIEGEITDPPTARHARGGVIAYSGVCTHAACGVSTWSGERRRLVCPCHGSEFDPATHAVVTAGPAPRPLPILPLAHEGEHFAVAAAFTGKVGLRKI